MGTPVRDTQLDAGGAPCLWLVGAVYVFRNYGGPSLSFHGVYTIIVHTVAYIKVFPVANIELDGMTSRRKLNIHKVVVQSSYHLPILIGKGGCLSAAVFCMTCDAFPYFTQHVISRMSLRDVCDIARTQREKGLSDGQRVIISFCRFSVHDMCTEPLPVNIPETPSHLHSFGRRPPPLYTHNGQSSGVDVPRC